MRASRCVVCCSHGAVQLGGRRRVALGRGPLGSWFFPFGQAVWDLQFVGSLGIVTTSCLVDAGSRACCCELRYVVHGM